jgi:hypothetical protein
MPPTGTLFRNRIGMNRHTGDAELILFRDSTRFFTWASCHGSSEVVENADKWQNEAVAIWMLDAGYWLLDASNGWQRKQSVGDFSGRTRYRDG